MNITVPKFIDQHSGFDAMTGGYVVTNEEPELFNELLKGVKVNRAATIASGGEVVLSTILLRAREVVAIDHCYQSLIYLCAKLLILQQLPRHKILTIINNHKNDALAALLQESVKHLPEPLLSKVLSKKLNFLTQYHLPSLRKEWRYAKPVNNISKLLDRLTIVHGDLSDLVPNFGTFDLLYVSNAMEHKNRNNKNPLMSEFVDMLNPGGLLLYTMAYSNLPPKVNAPFKPFAASQGFRSQWTHIIVQKEG